MSHSSFTGPCGRIPGAWRRASSSMRRADRPDVSSSTRNAPQRTVTCADRDRRRIVWTPASSAQYPCRTGNASAPPSRATTRPVGSCSASSRAGPPRSPTARTVMQSPDRNSTDRSTPCPPSRPIDSGANSGVPRCTKRSRTRSNRPSRVSGVAGPTSRPVCSTLGPGSRSSADSTSSRVRPGRQAEASSTASSASTPARPPRHSRRQTLARRPPHCILAPCLEPPPSPADGPTMSDDVTPNADSVEFGAATEDDLDRIAALFFADMVDLGQQPDQGKLREVTSEVLADRRASTVLRVARTRDEGLVVGVILANTVLSIKFPGKALWIEELYVAPGWRQLGIGRRLVEHLLAWGVENDYRGVELEAYRMNTAASILYRSLGFRRLARERYSYDLADLEDSAS
ncbi:MAG: GNAT family N-acetyltransferase [Deltaproteobacteria bacterium]|nr:MAG: GNAT family N-acetyltransferase [Deltaproteobacteria bacterium]